MKKNNYKTMKVGDIVSADFRMAEVFKKAGIDFCCSGSQNLEEACMEKKIDMTEIEKEIMQLENSEPDPAYNFAEWNLETLCDHIINTHHKTVMKLLPQLTFYTQKIADVHGAHHPELNEIANLFSQVNSELRQHLIREEDVLFPAIKTLLSADSADAKQIMLSEIIRMKTEHEFAGRIMDVIKDISMNYMVPHDACTTYQLTYKLLEEFEDDLHIHVHLENNIVYPKALCLAN
jgi:regulator of cell morphogenesis and NO signaling